MNKLTDLDKFLLYYSHIFVQSLYFFLIFENHNTNLFKQCYDKPLQ